MAVTLVFKDDEDNIIMETGYPDGAPPVRLSDGTMKAPPDVVVGDVVECPGRFYLKVSEVL